MNARIEMAHTWFHHMSPRYRFYLFLFGLVIIYAIVEMILIMPVSSMRKELADQIAERHTQHETAQSQINQLSQTIKNPYFIQLLDEQKRLTDQLASMQAQLEKLKPTLVSSTDMTKITKDILSQEYANVVLLNLLDLPIEPWPNTTAPGKAELATVVKGDLYQHGLQLELSADYFGTIAYLQKLEKMNWPIYWDSIVYKVVKYPTANVVLKIHVLSLQKN